MSNLVEYEIEYLEPRRATISFSPDHYDDERIVRRLVDSVTFPDYSPRRYIKGYRVVEKETGRVLAEKNWIE